VSLAAAHHDLERIRRGHERPRAIRELSSGNVREHMQPEDGIHLRVIHDTGRDHGLCACGRLTGRCAFFGGLKDELHRPWQPVLHLSEHLRRCQEHRHVCVVPARMHDTHLVALILTRGLAGKRHVGFLAHGQAVHVRSQGHHRPRQSTSRFESSGCS